MNLDEADDRLTHVGESILCRRKMSNGKAKNTDPRLVVLGAASVGKSALVVRFMTRRFIWEYDPTLEYTYKHQTTVDDELVTMDILDTAGDDFSNQREGQIRWGDGFVLVYSVNNRDSFENVQLIKKHLDEVKRTNVQCVLIGNKVDLYHERKVTTAEGENLAAEMSCAFYETSASDGSVEILEAFHELYREVKRRKALSAKPRRRSSAQQVKQVISKVLRGIQSGS